MSEKGRPAGRKPRRLLRAVLAIAAILILCGGAYAAYFFRELPTDPPAPFAEQNADIARGEYLTTIGNCVACHTTEGGAELAGGLKFKTPFGTLYSTNITSDRQHGIGGWSFEDFHRAMKHGVRPDGEHLYPAFPYTNFAKLSDSDIASIFAYLRTTQPVAQANRSNDMPFPFGNRGLLHFWKRLFHDDSPYSPDSSRTAEWNRGAYLVDGITHCGACHTPRNMLGGLKEGLALEGGIYTDQVANGSYRQWSTADLTPGKDGLAKWSGKDIADYLLTGKNAHTVIHGPMAEVFASTQKLKPADARAIGTYLSEMEPSADRIDLSLLRSRIDDGEQVYTVHCGTCHLPDGKGDTILGVSLRDNPLIAAEDPATLINVILYGPDLPPPPFVSNRTKMKPFGKRLSDEDVAAVATYLRSSFGNNASAVSPDQVADQR